MCRIISFHHLCLCYINVWLWYLAPELHKYWPEMYGLSFYKRSCICGVFLVFFFVFFGYTIFLSFTLLVLVLLNNLCTLKKQRIIYATFLTATLLLIGLSQRLPSQWCVGVWKMWWHPHILWLDVPWLYGTVSSSTAFILHRYH